jgi:hypothetical protein
MSTQAERLVRIEKGDVQKSVSEADFKHKKMAGLGGSTYEADGWKVVAFEDGTPYDAGEPATKYGLHAASRGAAIGTEGSNATDIDGNSVDDAYVASVGATLAAAPATTTTRKAPEPAPAPPTE